MRKARDLAKASRQVGLRRDIAEIRWGGADDFREDLQKCGTRESAPGVSSDSRAESVQEIDLPLREANGRHDGDGLVGHFVTGKLSMPLRCLHVTLGSWKRPTRYRRKCSRLSRTTSGLCLAFAKMKEPCSAAWMKSPTLSALQVARGA